MPINGMLVLYTIVLPFFPTGQMTMRTDPLESRTGSSDVRVICYVQIQTKGKCFEKNLNGLGMSVLGWVCLGWFWSNNAAVAKLRW